MPNAQLHPGDRVTWRYTPRGGYGYVIPVDGVVVRVGKRITIRVQRTNGEDVLRSVKAESLVVRDEPNSRKE
jgi:hypothetical protein